MVPLMSLWIPILLSAVIVFIASSIIHMLLTYHQGDFSEVPSEDSVREALRAANLPPGDYHIPYAASAKALSDPGWIEKATQGPNAMLTVMPNGVPAMGKSLTQWFIYCIVIGIFAAYVAGHAVQPGEDYLVAFRYVGTVAFVGYALGLPQNSIWYHKNWGATFRSMVDGLVYSLLTAGVFGWLWPS
jgi:hypothetical protein